MRCTCGTRAAWRVTARRCNYSTFNGGRRTPSAYSEVVCVRELGGCGVRWRTKAAYVHELVDYVAPPVAPPVCVDCGKGDLPDNRLVESAGDLVHEHACL